MERPLLTETVAALWRRAGGAKGELTLNAIPVSGNNRVYRVQNGDATAIAKWYFSEARLDAEWRLLTYAADLGLTCVPRPLARDNEARLALHSQIPGQKPTPDRIGAAEIDAAAAFLRALNPADRGLAAAALPSAAEAAFSCSAHMAVMERRLERLETWKPAEPIDHEARAFVVELRAYWASLRQGLTNGLSALGLDMDQELPLDHRCVSPSDFGFHNALRSDSGALAFVDFEYAGWDDPAKTLCDFFLQPAIPVNPAYRARFAAAAFSDWPDSDRLLARAKLLHPLFALKWCCIMLNPFVTHLAGPGRFADPTADPVRRKRQQLDKAILAFRRLEDD